MAARQGDGSRRGKSSGGGKSGGKSKGAQRSNAKGFGRGSDATSRPERKKRATGAVERDARDRPEEVWLVGRHAVREALRSGRWPMQRFWIEDGIREEEIAEFLELAESRGLRMERRARLELDAVSGGNSSRHQGVALKAGEFPFVDLKTTIDQDRARGKVPLVIFLDHLHDPHNAGAILRSADAAGVTCVAIPPRRQVGITSVVARISAGAASWVPIAQISNLAGSIEALKSDEFWIYGASGEGERTLYDLDLTGPTAIVIGGEGEGLRELTAKRCDEVVRIPMAGHVSSLNASVAAALFMFEAARQRRIKEAGQNHRNKLPL